MREDFTIAEATAEDWDEVAGWAVAEGWNPGLGDAACFRPTDPAGFLVGRLGGRVVSAVSLVAYSADFAFLGHYLVHPEHRGTGLGLATWKAAIPHAGEAVIGLDAVQAQVGTYGRAGFTAVHDTVRHTGRTPADPAAGPAAGPLAGPAAGSAAAPAPESAAGTVDEVTPYHLDAISAYDSGCFPAERHAFLSRWLTAEGHTARVLLAASGHVTGYGVVRPASAGHRVGPLFADTAEGAAALFDSLAATLPPGAEVSLDVPDHHPAALELAASRGLTESFRCTRMYTGPAPYIRTEAVWGNTTLELG